jgi:hypothetical protein
MFVLSVRVIHLYYFNKIVSSVDTNHNRGVYVIPCARILRDIESTDYPQDVE